MMLKATRFQDLAPLRRSLAEAAAREALRQQQRAEAVRRALEEQNLFKNTVGPVTPLRSPTTRRWQPSEPPAPEPRMITSMASAQRGNV